jgi:hypothetical protein
MLRRLRSACSTPAANASRSSAPAARHAAGFTVTALRAEQHRPPGRAVRHEPRRQVRAVQQAGRVHDRGDHFRRRRRATAPARSPAVHAAGAARRARTYPSSARAPRRRRGGSGGRCQSPPASVMRYAAPRPVNDRASGDAPAAVVQRAVRRDRRAHFRHDVRERDDHCAALPLLDISRRHGRTRSSDDRVNASGRPPHAAAARP